jgi:hypothetical protein
MEVEEQARQLGWVPQEEFQGDPARWRSAEEYVARGESLLPLLKADKRKLEEDLHGIKGELTSTKQALTDALEAIEAFKEFANGSAKKDFEVAVNSLQEQVIAAREAGDVRAELKAEEALRKLGTEAPVVLKKTIAATPPPPAPARETPEFQAWKAKNSDWLEVDKPKTAYAASMAAFVRATTSLEGAEFFERVTELTEEKFAKREPVDRTGAPNNRGGSTGAKNYANLPADAKAACDRQGTKLVGPGRAYKTDAEWRAAYVSRYDWS